MAGWIKLYRDIQNHWIWDDSLRLKWWIDLLLLANHKEGRALINGELKTIETGEHLTSELKLAERWGVSRGRVHRFLQLLENDEMISIEKCRQNGTTIKVSNYGLYQANITSRCATDGTMDDTMDGQPMMQRAAHKQEDKTDKEGKKDKNNSPPTPRSGGEENAASVANEKKEIWAKHSADFSPALSAAVKNWGRYKTERRESYKAQGFNSLLVQICKHAEMYGDEAVIDVIERSMASGYVGIVWKEFTGKGAGVNATHKRDNAKLGEGMAGFKNALDRFDDDGNEIVGLDDD